MTTRFINGRKFVLASEFNRERNRRMAAEEDLARLREMLGPDIIEARKLLADLEARIDAAPSTAKPVFPGIAWLHDLVWAAKKGERP